MGTISGDALFVSVTGQQTNGQHCHGSVRVSPVARAAILAGRGRRCLQAFDAVLYLVYIIGSRVRGVAALVNRLEVDAVLREQGLISPEAVDELPLLRLLLPPAWGVGGDHLAVDAGLDAVGTRLLLVTADLALLAEDTAVAPGQFDGGFGCTGMARGRRGKGSHVTGE